MSKTNLPHGFYLQKVWNKCRDCAKPADCLIIGRITRKGKNIKMKVLGAKCDHCGLRIEADMYNINKLICEYD